MCSSLMLKVKKCDYSNAPLPSFTVKKIIRWLEFMTETQISLPATWVQGQYKMTNRQNKKHESCPYHPVNNLVQIALCYGAIAPL